MVRGLIAPHAGFFYSGPTAAFAYKYMSNESMKDIKRIFLLGPSHHENIPHPTKGSRHGGCALTKNHVYSTPLGDIKVDNELNHQLLKSHASSFMLMDRETDEAEHSLEMHLPYIKKMIGDLDIQLVPILVGHLSDASKTEYGEILAPFIKETSNFFIVSSDFCHWGNRFRYQYYNKDDGEIFESVKKLDIEGMKHISAINCSGFKKYLSTTENTICGRDPISVMMEAITVFNKSVSSTTKSDDKKLRFHFVYYDQSSSVKDWSDSSVSYASAILY